jgi:hypothetical protein
MVILSLLMSIFVPAWAFADGRLKNNDFAIEYGSRGITSLKRVGDAYDTEYLATGAVLGNLVIQYESRGETAWTVARDPALAADPAPGSQTLTYSIRSAKSSRLKADETFTLLEAKAAFADTTRADTHGTKGRVVLVRQYRHGLCRMSVELPAGWSIRATLPRPGRTGSSPASAPRHAARIPAFIFLPTSISARIIGQASRPLDAVRSCGL